MKKDVRENSDKKKIKDFFSKFWFVVWKDDSFKGWLISLAFIFVIIKFIFFPFLSFVTGTPLPLAIVESCSMYHEGNLFGSYPEWFERHENKYEEFGITEEQFKEFKMKKGFNKGDILFIIGAKPEKLEVGDIIIFTANYPNPIIHRIVEINENPQTQERTFSTIGDNNNGQLTIEENINENRVIGKASLKIAPYIGWGKLIFFESRRSSSERGFCNEK